MSEENKTIHTPENWDAASEGYAERIAPFLMSKYAGALIHRLSVNPHHHVLEIAAGSGALTLKLAHKVNNLIAIDFSPKMLVILKRRLDAVGINNVQLVEMDGQSLQFADNVFDRVASSFALMLFPDRKKGFSEIHRVLKPGGKVAISGWAGPDRFESFQIFMQAIKTAFPDFPDPPSPPPVFSLSNPDSFKMQMEEAGFQDVKVDFVTRESSHNNLDEMWAQLTTGAPPVQALFNKVGEKGKDKIYHSLSTVIRERFGDGPITMTNTATMGYGIKPG